MKHTWGQDGKPSNVCSTCGTRWSYGRETRSTMGIPMQTKTYSDPQGRLLRVDALVPPPCKEI